MKAMAWFSAVAVSLFYLVSGVYLGFKGYELGRDIDALEHRAQVAADAEDMLGYMQTLKGNLEKYDATHGYTAVIFKTPANDLGLLYESVNRIISRLEQIKELPKNEAAYQVGLDDLRGTIRELEAPAEGILWVRNWGLIWIMLLIWIWPTTQIIVYLIQE